MPSYTKEIVLEEITVQDFQAFREQWGMHPHCLREGTIVSKVLDTLKWPLLSEGNPAYDYRRFLEFLLEHPCIDQISVNEQGRWVKEYSRRMNHATIAEFASIASRDRYKYNYLEAKFRERYLGEIISFRPIIQFTEYQAGEGEAFIVGHRVTVPKAYEHLFTISVETSEYFMNEGIWTLPQALATGRDTSTPISEMA